MKTNLSAQKIQKHIGSSLITKTLLKPEIIVESGILELDNLLGGFKAGEITFIDGDSDLISLIPNQICVNTYRTFGEETIYLDGGMCTDPYEIAKYARRLELDQKEVLRHVRIARAFTVHQLSSLIEESLEPAIKMYNPRSLIIGKFPILFLDSDIKANEAKTLLKNNLEKIKNLTENYELVTIFTNLDRRMSLNQRNVRRTIYENVNEIVKMRQNEHSIYIELANKKKDATILTFATGQMRLQDFGMVI